MGQKDNLRIACVIVLGKGQGVEAKEESFVSQTRVG